MQFYYFSGEEVVEGDVVITGNQKPGIVVEVLQPGTERASAFSSPSGGIIIEEDWGTAKGLIVETPPDRDEWEDLVFVRRGS